MNFKNQIWIGKPRASPIHPVSKLLLIMSFEGRNCSKRFSLHFWLFLPSSSAAAVKTDVSEKVCIFSPCSWILKTKYELESQEQALSILFSKLLLKMPSKGRSCSRRFSLHFGCFCVVLRQRRLRRAFRKRRVFSRHVHEF